MSLKKLLLIILCFGSLSAAAENKKVVWEKYQNDQVYQVIVNPGTQTLISIPYAINYLTLSNSSNFKVLTSNNANIDNNRIIIIAADEKSETTLSIIDKLNNLYLLEIRAGGQAVYSFNIGDKPEVNFRSEFRAAEIKDDPTKKALIKFIMQNKQRLETIKQQLINAE